MPAKKENGVNSSYNLFTGRYFNSLLIILVNSQTKRIASTLA